MLVGADVRGFYDRDEKDARASLIQYLLDRGYDIPKVGDLYYGRYPGTSATELAGQ